MDLKMILLQKENYSEFCRYAIIEKLDRENDQQLIDSEIKKHEDKIRELKDRKKGKNYDKNKVNEILNKYYDQFKSSGRDTAEDYMVISWINRSIMPELRAAGCKDLDARAVLNKFVNGRI